MTDNKSSINSSKISFIGIIIIILGDVGFIVQILIIFPFTADYYNFIGPLINLIGLIVFWIGVLFSFFNTFDSIERTKIILTVLFAVSITVYIISLFFRYTPFLEAYYYGWFYGWYIYIGSWIGFLFVLYSLLVLNSHNFRVSLILNIIGILSMTVSLVLFIFVFEYYGFTFSFYLYVISIVINVIAIIPCKHLLKETKHVITHFKLSKVAKAGIYLLVITSLTFLANIIVPTGSSYAFFSYIAPVELFIGIILLTIGLILSMHDNEST